jgi:hemolysin D
VTPAQSLVAVVPDGPLEIEAMISNLEAQEGEIKVDTFTFTRYGMLQRRSERLARFDRAG